MEDLKSGELDYDRWYGEYVEGRAAEEVGGESEKALTSGENSGIIKSTKSEAAVDNVISEYIGMGKIDTSYFGDEFGKLQTDEIIVTNERIEHIRERHPQDVQLFEQYGNAVISSPDLVLKDEKNSGTVFMVKKLPDTNLNVVVRLALSTDKSGLKNSVMTFYRIRQKNLAKLEKNNKTLYKRE